MTKNINQAINLTSYFITLPPSRFIVFAIIAIGLLFGILINFGSGKPILSWVEDGLILLTLPALLSSFIVKLMSRKMPYRRIAATALAGEVVYAIAYGLSIPISKISGNGEFLAQLVILVGSAIVFVIWYLIARFIFLHKYRSLLFALIHLLIYVIFLISNQALYVTSEPFINIAAKFSLSAVVLMGALILFFIIINAPMKKNLGLSSTDAVSYLFSQWLYHNKDVEKVFEQVGEDVKTIISVAGFKRKGDTVFFVTPCVHFGPFGNLGGSEFSSLIAKEMDKKYGSKTFVFHGTVTHDLNPVATSELKKILAAADSAISEAKYAEAKVSITVGKHDECRAEALRINDSAIIGLSRAPQVTEDVNFGLGLSLLFEAQKQASQAMIIDQHNAETGDITSFEPGSLVGYRYLNAVRDSLSRKAEQKALRVGVALRSTDSDVVGAAGVKVAVLSSNPEYVMVLIDSNGVTPSFRDRIESEVKAAGKSMKRNFAVGIFTTDTHQTNMVRGVLNPLKEEEAIIGKIRDAVREAAADMQDAKFFCDTRWFDIKVLGAKQSIEVISTVNSIVAVAKITLPLLLIAGVLILLAIATQLQ
jgi:putative membrane protein